MSGDFGDLIDQSTNLRTLAPAAVGSQVALMTVISVRPTQCGLCAQF